MSFVDRVVIVGAGSSASTPMLHCSVSSDPCEQCKEAMAQGHASPNHRLNPSLLIQIRQDGGALRNVLVDVGKTFRESAFKVLRPNGVKTLDTVLLTHDHADACWGLDDLREFDPSDPHDVTRVVADERTTASMQRVFPYLFPSEADATKKNWTAKLQWLPMTDSMELHGVVVQRLRVLHGPEYYCNAFVIPIAARGGTESTTTANDGVLVYMSDVSAVPVEVEQALQQLPSIQVLVLDMMSMRDYVSHFSMTQSVEFAKRINAERTVFVGMSHSMNYARLNEQLRNDGHSSMALGRDGLVLVDAGVPVT